MVDRSDYCASLLITKLAATKFYAGMHLHVCTAKQKLFIPASLLFYTLQKFNVFQSAITIHFRNQSAASAVLYPSCTCAKAPSVQRDQNPNISLFMKDRKLKIFNLYSHTIKEMGAPGVP
jgi:hypothetical protein